VPDSVDVAFELMLQELDRKTDDLNSEGAAQFRNSNYAEATNLATARKSLREFRKKVELLRQDWLDNHSATFPTTETEEIESITRTIASASKAPKTVLVVKFSDGEIIYEKTAAETFAQAIRKFGFSSVAALGFTINHERLVSTKQPSRYNYTTIDGYHVVTHCSTEQKRELLERISGQLRIPVEINIVPG
jgi:hypothetical protein